MSVTAFCFSVSRANLTGDGDVASSFSDQSSYVNREELA
jgi:hypothetical protein